MEISTLLPTTLVVPVIMKNQIDISAIVDAVYETVLYLSGDAHLARWDAYWTLTTLMYKDMEIAA